MASPLKCDLCDNQATVHLTQIVNHKFTKWTYVSPARRRKA